MYIYKHKKDDVIFYIAYIQCHVYTCNIYWRNNNYYYYGSCVQLIVIHVYTCTCIGMYGDSQVVSQFVLATLTVSVWLV